MLQTSRRAYTLALVCSLVLPLLSTAQHVTMQAGYGADIQWGYVLEREFLNWGAWVLVSPLIIVAANRYRLDDDHRVNRVVAWIAFGIALSVVQATLMGAISRTLGIRSVGVIVAISPTGFAANPAHVQRVGLLHLPPDSWLNQIVSPLAQNLLLFGLVVGVMHAVRYQQDLRAKGIREADLEARLARSELNSLRMQLQPHFLFNTLHTVSALMARDVPSARRVLAALGDLLRTSIDHMSRQEVTLRDELAFVARYVEIQQARFRQRLHVFVEVPAELLDAMVPNLVLQPLVENAIQHGIEPHVRAGHIWITASRAGDELLLAVRDDGPPPAPAIAPPPGLAPPRTSVGLANIEARLEQLYGPAHKIDAGPHPDGGFFVTLRFPLGILADVHAPAHTNQRRA